MGVLIGIVLSIGLAHFCRLRHDNLAALGFVSFALWLIWPGWLSAAWKVLVDGWESLSPALGSGLVGSLILLALAIIGCRYIILGRR